MKLISKEDLPCEEVVKRNNIYISPPYKYINFAIEFCNIIGVYEDENDYKQTIYIFKLFKNV